MSEPTTPLSKQNLPDESQDPASKAATDAPRPQQANTSRIKLFRRRVCILPTFRGLAVLILVLLLGAGAGSRFLYPFLAPNQPMNGGALVVEGWGDDFLLKRAVQEYDTRHYGAMYVTGNGMEPGTMFAEFRTVADFSSSIIRQLSEGRISPQPVTGPDVHRDRTFTSALQTREWMQAHGGIPDKVTVLSLGPHSRRTWLLYSKAFGKAARVGIISAEPVEYAPAHWWRSSEGFRAVMSEAAAYCYARLMFWRSGD